MQHQAGPPSSTPSRRHRGSSLQGYLFIAPAFLILLVFVAAPAVWVIGLSTFNWDLIGSGAFVGLQNYAQLLADPTWWQAFRQTLYYVAVSVPVGIVLALGLALLLDRPILGRSAFRGAVFAPYVTPAVATLVIWEWIFQPHLRPAQRHPRHLAPASRGLAHRPARDHARGHHLHALEHGRLQHGDLPGRPRQRARGAAGGAFALRTSAWPSGSAGAHPPIAGTNACVFSSASQAEQQGAFQYIKYFDSTQKTADWSQGTAYLPVRQSAAAAMASYYAQNPGPKVAQEQLPKGVFGPSNPGWDQAASQLTTQLFNALQGTVPVSQALATAQGQATTDLQQGNG